MRRAAAAVLLFALLAPVSASALGATRLARVLDRQIKLAGPYSGAYVADVESETPLYGYDATVPRVPGSVQKLWTTAAVLATFRDRDRLTTAVLKDQPITLDGSVNGNLYLRGAGDPTLTTRDIKALARQVHRAGVLHLRGRVVGDATAFDARRGLASADFQATPDVPPLSALMLDRGQIREGLVAYQRHPAHFAAEKLTRALRAHGTSVRRRPATGRTPLLGLAVAAVRSPPVRTLLRRQNVESDNYVAELLLRTLGRSGGARGTTARGAAVVRGVARRRFGTRPAVVDGSGISRGNASAPRDVVALLVREFGDPAFVRSLPITGRTGTVAYRLRGPVTDNRCRAKTGTLDDVSALAGYCGTLGGQTLAFAIINNGVYPYAAHVLQDRMVTAIASYDP